MPAKPKTKNNHGSNWNPERWSGPPVALFWDQSLVWGVICVETLLKLDVPFRVVSSQDIVRGCLDECRVLLTPGGWASHKIQALGEAGAKRMRDFVERGGSYLGFCGGAGLALSSSPSLGLVPQERLSIEERLPSASGGIWIRGAPDHPVWKNLPEELPVSVWWPSQFSMDPLPRSLCLASYRSVGADFQVADLPVCDLGGPATPWKELERAYGINLNPARLIGQPAILEVSAARGKVILSYPHMETPGDEWGNRLFRNCLGYLDREASRHIPWRLRIRRTADLAAPPCGKEALDQIRSALDTVNDLIHFGERHLFWRWRRQWLLQWQRGIRGLEYGSLAVSISYIFEKMTENPGRTSQPDPWFKDACSIREGVELFCRNARRLLMEEKIAAQGGILTKLGEVNEKVDDLRMRLFGARMNHGGICRALFDDIDRFLLKLLRIGQPCRNAISSTIGDPERAAEGEKSSSIEGACDLTTPRDEA